MSDIHHTADILGTGTAYNIKGLAGYYYEGLLFEKNNIRSNRFDDGKHYLIDVKNVSDLEITEYYGISIFYDDKIPVETLQGEKYFILEDKPRFGRISVLEDFNKQS